MLRNLLALALAIAASTLFVLNPPDLVRAAVVTWAESNSDAAGDE